MCSRLLMGSASTPDEPEQTRDRRADPLAQRAGVRAQFRRRRRERTQIRKAVGLTRCPACRSPCRRRREDAECARHPDPTPRGPCARFLQSAAAKLSAVIPLRAASPASTQGAKSADLQLRKGQQQIAQVALRIDRDSGNAVDGGFFEQREAQAGLAAAGHADANRVRRQVARVIQEEIGSVRAARRIDFAAEIEGAELFVRGRGSWQAVSG